LLSKKASDFILIATMSGNGPMQPIGFVGPSVSFWMMTGLHGAKPYRTESGRWAEHCIQIGKAFKALSDKGSSKHY